MQNKNITAILPLHKINEDYKTMLSNAVNSMENFHNDVKLLIVCPSEVKGEIDTMNLSETIEISYNVHTGDTDFVSQVNRGIQNCQTEWFTILEVDDEFKSIWLKSVTQCVAENPEVDVFLPVVKDINVEGKFVSFTNESVWAYGFTEKQGFLDNEVLLEFQNFQTSGGLYRTQVIIDNGLIKDNIKLTFSYELFLRLTHNGVKVLTVPRIGYQHLNFRPDSLFWEYKNNDETKLSEDEAKFWLETAKKEFFFKNKRDVNYVTA
jgi:hypothetical protein